MVAIGHCDWQNNNKKSQDVNNVLLSKTADNNMAFTLRLEATLRSH